MRYDEEVAWYLDAISRGLPRDGGAAAHPKVAATVRRVVELWQKGEKVVVFCHFRKTGTALRRHVSNAIDAQLRSSVSTAFGVAEHDVQQRLERIANRLYVRRQGGSPLAREAQRELAAIASATPEQRERLVDVLMRFLRSPVTLARHGAALANERAGSLRAVLDAERDGGSLRSRFAEFIRFFDGRIAAEREELLRRSRTSRPADTTPSAPSSRARTSTTPTASRCCPPCASPTAQSSVRRAAACCSRSTRRCCPTC